MKAKNTSQQNLLLLACFTLTLPAPGFGQAYTITDLGSNTWYYSEAHGINNLGNVAGEYEPTNPPASVLGFFYSNGVMTDVGHLGGLPYAVAYALNDTNVVVGESDTALTTHGFSYYNGTLQDLGSKAGPTAYSSAHGINRSGQIVGESSLSFAQTSTIHAMLYTSGAWKDLGALGGDYSAAFGINNSEVIVGESDIVEQGVTNLHAFVYTNTAPSAVMQDLKTLTGGSYSSARAINDSGVIVGESDTLIGGSTFTHAFVCRNGTMSDLGTLGGSASSASAINSAGQIVGYANDANELANAFLYNGSTMVNLIDFLPPNSGWTNLASADAINDAGQIAGSGLLADGSFHAYLLTPSAAAIFLTAPTMLPDHQFQVTVEGIPGQRFAILGSTNLANWTSLNTNTLSGISMVVTNPPASNGYCCYYRALLLP